MRNTAEQIAKELQEMIKCKRKKTDKERKTEESRVKRKGCSTLLNTMENKKKTQDRRKGKMRDKNACITAKENRKQRIKNRRKEESCQSASTTAWWTHWRASHWGLSQVRRPDTHFTTRAERAGEPRVGGRLVSSMFHVALCAFVDGLNPHCSLNAALTPFVFTRRPSSDMKVRDNLKGLQGIRKKKLTKIRMLTIHTPNSDD